MLTLNAENHPLMHRFHRPGAEKRGLVVLPRDAYDDWLASRSTDEARSFLNLMPADRMVAEPWPAPARKNVAPQLI